MKLTKEQAEYLIGEVESHASKNIHLERFSNFQLDALAKIINQCAEEEFPSFSCKDRRGSVISAGFAPMHKCILLNRRGEANLYEDWIMEMEQFKEFAVGVAAIDKWLEGKND